MRTFARFGFFIGLCIQQNAYSDASLLPWNDLENRSTYTLMAPLSLAPHFTLPAGQTLELKSSIALGEVPVINYEFKLKVCSAELSKKSTPLVVIHSFGVELSPGCILNFYLEPKDIYQLSPFQ